MGRGLSPLQRHILAEAGRRRRVFYAEVLEGYFGWEPVRPLKRYKAGDKEGYPKQRPIPREQVGMLRSPGDHYFSRRAIGAARYNSAMASLSRACARLGDRGLVTCLYGTVCRWSGVEITDKGSEWLSVNTLVIEGSVNR
jgi:hypothetical protein